MLAMTGKECVAVACDTRFGEQYSTLTMNFPRVFRAGKRCLVGLAGLGTDIQLVSKKIQTDTALFTLEEHREMQPRLIANSISSMLYDRRFKGGYYVEPLVAGLQKEGERYVPYICGMDSIGAPATPEDFLCIGTAAGSMLGICESLWQKDLEKEDLFETISQCMLSALDRDAFSGWGCVVYIITKDDITIRELRSRQD